MREREHNAAQVRDEGRTVLSLFPLPRRGLEDSPRGLFIVPAMLGAIFMVFMVDPQHGWNSVNMGRGTEFQVTLLRIALFVVGNGRVGADEA